MFRRIRSFCTSTRRRKVITATVTTLVVCVSTALAYLLITSGAGSGSATLGSATGSLTLNPTFANGLTPGTQEAFNVPADNHNSSAGQVNSITVQSITDSVPSCDATQFDIVWPTGGNNSSTKPTYTLNTPVAVPANSTGTNVLAGAAIQMKDNGQDQSSCAASTLTVNLTSG